MFPNWYPHIPEYVYQHQQQQQQILGMPVQMYNISQPMQQPLQVQPQIVMMSPNKQNSGGYQMTQPSPGALCVCSKPITTANSSTNWHDAAPNSSNTTVNSSSSSTSQHSYTTKNSAGYSNKWKSGKT